MQVQARLCVMMFLRYFIWGGWFVTMAAHDWRSMRLVPVSVAALVFVAFALSFKNESVLQDVA